MIQKKSDDAVSPVIGVMLMIVIVVIIAAVVTAFATGMMSETEAAPVAALDVEILNSEASLYNFKGPELFITHRSGDAVDTKDIELRFSWVCGVPGCTSGGVHSSTYSADGFKEEHPTGLNTGTSGDRMQALYVKSTMSPERTEYGSVGINHYFGDVILTPGLKLTASSEFLPENTVNTGSGFMDVIFNNYDITTSAATKGKVAQPSSHPADKCSRETCDSIGDDMQCYSGPYSPLSPEERENVCYECDGMYGLDGRWYHLKSECGNAELGLDFANCLCMREVDIPGTSGIMEHLPAGTSVDVMIIHTPSGKAIYDKTVIVE